MFDNANQKTELMIVCDEKIMEYANYLMGLIGQKDDVDESVVGVRLYTARSNRCTANWIYLGLFFYPLFYNTYRFIVIRFIRIESSSG